MRLQGESIELSTAVQTVSGLGLLTGTETKRGGGVKNDEIVKTDLG